MINSLLPIYEEKTLKNFQKLGNFQNFELDMIQSDYQQMLNFITPFFEYDSEFSITSLVIYKYAPELLEQCYTNAQLIAIRETELSITDSRELDDLLRENKTIDGTAYRRIYAKNFRKRLGLSRGIFEIVLTVNNKVDETTIFESELFSTCLMKAALKSRIVCSNAACADVERGTSPVFTIDVDEIGGVAGSGSLMVVWDLYPVMLFENLVFNNIIFPSDAYKETETQTFSLAALGSDTLEFTTNTYLPAATYTINWTSDFGCSGSLQFSVTFDEFEKISSGWTDSSPASGWQNVPYSFSVRNNDIISQRLTLDVFLNTGNIRHIDEILAAGETKVYDFNLNVNRNNNNTIYVIGDLSFSDTLALVLPS